MTRKELRLSRPIPPTQSFENRTTATLEAQDRILERLEQKLESPVLNGGFEELTKKVDKIEDIQISMRDSISDSSKKIADIHAVIYDPEKGMYVTLKSHAKWIDHATSTTKWIGSLFVTGILAGLGKLIYDFVTGHIKFTP